MDRNYIIISVVAFILAFILIVFVIKSINKMRDESENICRKTNVIYSPSNTDTPKDVEVTATNTINGCSLSASRQSVSEGFGQPGGAGVANQLLRGTQTDGNSNTVSQAMSLMRPPQYVDDIGNRLTYQQPQLSEPKTTGRSYTPEPRPLSQNWYYDGGRAKTPTGGLPGGYYEGGRHSVVHTKPPQQQVCVSTATNHELRHSSVQNEGSAPDSKVINNGNNGVQNNESLASVLLASKPNDQKDGIKPVSSTIEGRVTPAESVLGSGTETSGKPPLEVCRIDSDQHVKVEIPETKRPDSGIGNARLSDDDTQFRTYDQLNDLEKRDIMNMKDISIFIPEAVVEKLRTVHGDLTADVNVVIAMKKGENSGTTHQILRRSTMIKHSVMDHYRRFSRFKLFCIVKNGTEIYTLKFHDYTPYFKETPPSYDVKTHTVTETKSYKWISFSTVVWNRSDEVPGLRNIKFLG